MVASVAQTLSVILCLAVPAVEQGETAWSQYVAELLGGEAEARMPDGSRVDVLTGDLAIEVEWCKSGKVYEAVGQAGYYQATANRRGCVVLLMGREPLKQEIVFYLRCVAVCAEFDLPIYAVNVQTGQWLGSQP
jgi:hypothetical protein